MSSLTSCNYCSLRRIKDSVKGTGARTVLKGSEFMGGTDVYVVLKGEKLKEGDHDNNKQYRSWMMEIPERCVC